MSSAYEAYVESLETRLDQLYALGRAARSKGLDPEVEPECKLAKDLADLVEGLVGPEGVAESIRDLSSKLAREELSFKIAEEIVYGKFGHLEPEVAAEQAIRTALAILTEGLTAAPLQGIARVRIKANNDRTKYLAVYFAGPIRSAGGTDQALTLVLADFVRRLLGLDRYKPTKEEIARFVDEIRLYESSVSRFQYHISDEELQRALRWLPVEVTGTESDPVEVSSFRNLPRVETNRVRGGALRVVNDGIVGRSAKVCTIIEKIGIEGWDWLGEVREISEEKKSADFMSDVIAGRPIFSSPSRRGGFRLRYGRSRNTGLAAVGVHPITMSVLQDFLAAGTQLRLEFPGKGGIVVPVDCLEPPIVRLNGGSVSRVTAGNLDDVKPRIEKILYLGDILVSFGDFLYNNKPLLPSGYVEEWWTNDVKEAVRDRFGGDLQGASEASSIPIGRLQSIIGAPFSERPNGKEAVKISSSLGIPLHPYFTYFWSNLISAKKLQMLREWLSSSEKSHKGDFVSKIVGRITPEVKEALETICVPHSISEGKILIEKCDAVVFEACLRSRTNDPELPSDLSILDAIKAISGLSVSNKAPSFVGARMGRPEKAKRRELNPLVHVLFPVGLAGGARRNIVEAARGRRILVEIVDRRCPVCKKRTIEARCGDCGSRTEPANTCPKCGRTLKTNTCPTCKMRARSYSRQLIDLEDILDKAMARVGVKKPKMLKGVRGLINQLKIPEMMEKGILRAKHDLSVYKDGTIRYDATNAPLTHFKPCEVGVSIDKLYKLGYKSDLKGQPLSDPEQICELKIQDVIIPRKCGKYLLKIAAFLDETLTSVYDLPPHYDIDNVDDLVGELIVGQAPHTCVGVLGRILGFTDSNVCYAHPIWHSAKRRDCDGDEDAMMLALDPLLNFSRKYLPQQIGGIMDAPLLMISIVNPKEVQRQAHDVDVSSEYPKEFYERTLERVDSRSVSALIDLIEDRLGTPDQFEGFSFTTPVTNISSGNRQSLYKRLKTMVEKLNSQLELAEKILAVDADQVALKVLTTHFIRDIAGNLRAFSTQVFRCKSCSKRYRRLPLRGKCPSCGGALTLTVHRGGIEKYLNVAESLIEKYKLPNYYSQRIQLARQEIAVLFDSRKPKQISLVRFV